MTNENKFQQLRVGDVVVVKTSAERLGFGGEFFTEVVEVSEEYIYCKDDLFYRQNGKSTRNGQVWYQEIIRKVTPSEIERSILAERILDLLLRTYALRSLPTDKLQQVLQILESGGEV